MIHWEKYIEQSPQWEEMYKEKEAPEEFQMPKEVYEVELKAIQDDSKRGTFVHKDAVYCVALHPTAPYLVSGSGDDTAYMWNYHTGHRWQLLSFKDSVSDLAWSTDGKYLAASVLDGHVAVWEFDVEKSAGLTSRCASFESSCFDPRAEKRPEKEKEER